MTNPTTSDRYYQLALLWPTDPPKFGHYCQLAAPIVAPYGGGLERQFTPATIHATGMTRPDTINLVYYASKQAFEAFVADEAFRAIVHLRSESTRMLSVEGSSVRVGPPASAADALYVIEIARFAAGGADAYQAYEREAEPIMARYGYHVERVLRAESAGGLSFEPDIVKVAYFESADGVARLEADPAHARIEAELYPKAVAESIWITASAAALTVAHHA
jgi:uncharacterized protein (DUF1330 family)